MLPISKAQQALLNIIGKRFVFAWTTHFCISDRDGGYAHGYYDREREKDAKRAHCHSTTLWGLVKKGWLVKVASFKADACGNRAYIYRPTILTETD